jgi:uncharacterized membrane protein (UPF0182 family)
VLVAFGNQIVMEETLEQSLQRISGGKAPARTPEPLPAGDARSPDQNLARQALEHFQRSREFLKQGDWAGYGEELRRVETLLRDMQKAP